MGRGGRQQKPKGVNFTTPLGLKPVLLADLERLPPAVAVTSETIREGLYLWRIGFWGGRWGR